MQHELLVTRAQGDALKELIERLEKALAGPPDPRLQEADQLEAWARLNQAHPDRKRWLDRAGYLRTLHKLGIEG